MNIHNFTTLETFMAVVDSLQECYFPHCQLSEYLKYSTYSILRTPV